MINVLLVDDQTLVRHGIKSLLGLSSKINVVGEAENGLSALNFLADTNAAVDVVLMDIRMPKMIGIEALATMRDKDIDTPVIMLTTFDDHESFMQVIKAVANG